MKNIHLLPNDSGTNHHIYITSDKEIKEGDWYLTFTNKKVIGKPRKCEDTNWSFTHCKKIILTTDPELIKDGIQAIDDEFLEWFVKNPSCEWVKVEPREFLADKVIYEIIIPQEEPKQGFPLFDKEKSDAITKSGRELVRKLQSKTEQETLEEASWKYNPLKKLDGEFIRAAFINGAKWQAERMYSEEEVIEILTLRCKEFSTKNENFQKLLLKQDLEWFEKNKKK